jgi:hypothetical protein
MMSQQLEQVMDDAFSYNYISAIGRIVVRTHVHDRHKIAQVK